MKVGVVGLGKLGLPYAEVLSRVAAVDGFDISDRMSSAINIVETMEACVKNKDIVFLILPTPHEAEYDGSTPTTHLPPRGFSCETLHDTLVSIDTLIPDQQEVCIVSTVLPGTIRRDLASVTDRARLIYSPSFMAMGSVEEDFLDPEYFLLGSDCGDDKDFSTIKTLLQKLTPRARFVTGTWEEAESIKIFYNTFISFKLVFVNMIQDISMRLGHIDVDRVTEGLCAARKRIISEQYMKAGMGDGGPCHPRDNIALRQLSQSLKLNYDLFGAITLSREKQAQNLATFLCQQSKPVLLTSRTYKSGVPYTNGSYALLVSEFIKQNGQEVEFLDDIDQMPTSPRTILLVHDISHQEYVFPDDSIVVDPWRRYKNDRYTVIHYGNSRPVPGTRKMEK